MFSIIIQGLAANVGFDPNNNCPSTLNVTPEPILRATAAPLLSKNWGVTKHVILDGIQTIVSAGAGRGPAASACAVFNASWIAAVSSVIPSPIAPNVLISMHSAYTTPLPPAPPPPADDPAW